MPSGKNIQINTHTCMHMHACKYSFSHTCAQRWEWGILKLKKSQLVSLFFSSLTSLTLLAFGDVYGSPRACKPGNWSKVPMLVSKMSYPHSNMNPSETMGFDIRLKLFWLSFATGHPRGERETEVRKLTQMLKLKKEGKLAGCHTAFIGP